VDFNEIKISKLFSYEYYDELPIEFNFTGPYHNMGRMMARLENLKMINARKGKFSMTPYREVGGGRRRTFGRRSFNLEEDNKNKITMSLAASSFIFKSKGGDFGVQGF
jgi:Tfp pilus assembly protein PilO